MKKNIVEKFKMLPALFARGKAWLFLAFVPMIGATGCEYHYDCCPDCCKEVKVKENNSCIKGDNNTVVQVINGVVYVGGVPQDTVKPTPVKPDPVKPDPVKPDPVKPTPVKPDPVKPEPVVPCPCEDENSDCCETVVEITCSKIVDHQYKYGGVRGDGSKFRNSSR